MAETVGLVLGTLSVFDQALECFRYVRVGRDFGNDFEMYQLRLDLLGLRLSRWGKVAGMDSASSDDDLTFPKDRCKQAKETLNGIVKQFERATTNEKDLLQDKAITDSSQMSTLSERIEILAISRLSKKRKNSLAAKINGPCTRRTSTLSSWITSKSSSTASSPYSFPTQVHRWRGIFAPRKFPILYRKTRNFSILSRKPSVIKTRSYRNN